MEAKEELAATGRKLARRFPAESHMRGVAREALAEIAERSSYHFTKKLVAQYEDIVEGYDKRVQRDRDAAHQRAVKDSLKIRKSDEMARFLAQHGEMTTHMDFLHEIFEKWLVARRKQIEMKLPMPPQKT